MDYRLGLMCGIDLPIPKCGLVIHQPTIKEISYIGESSFFIGIQTLCLHKSMFLEDKSVIQDVTNFQIFMTIMKEPEAIEQREAVIDLFSLIFPSYKVNITNGLIFTAAGKDPSMIDETNFESLQEICRLVFCANSGLAAQQNFNPANDKARAIAEKIMAGRRKVAELKGEDTASVFSQYLSILTFGIPSMGLFELMNLTMFQLYDLVERYGLYSAWDMNIRVGLAGGKPNDSTEDWTKNIHSNK